MCIVSPTELTYRVIDLKQGTHACNYIYMHMPGACDKGKQSHRLWVQTVNLLRAFSPDSMGEKSQLLPMLCVTWPCGSTSVLYEALCLPHRRSKALLGGLCGQVWVAEEVFALRRLSYWIPKWSTDKQGFIHLRRVAVCCMLNVHYVMHLASTINHLLSFSDSDV